VHSKPVAATLKMLTEGDEMTTRSEMRGLVARLLAKATAAALLAGLVFQAPGLRAKAPATAAPTEPVWAQELVRGLNYPSALVWLPDGDILIAERQGGIRRIHDGKLLTAPLAGAPPAYQSLLNGYRDIALDPQFRTNRLVWLLVSEGNYDRHWPAVWQARYEKGRLVDARRVYRPVEEFSATGPEGGRIAFMPDGTLLVSVPCSLQVACGPDSVMGKVIRITRDGGVPHDNPFIGRDKVLPELWTSGHRVQNGLFVDPVDRKVWEVEPGPRGGDELNLLEKGADYGWPRASWGFSYDGNVVAPRQLGEGITDPLLTWMPAVTPAAVMRYHGQVYPGWDGDLFVAALTGRALERLRFSGKELMQRERLLVGLNERIRDVAQGPDGYLYVLTDHGNGRLLRLVPGRPAAKARPARPLPLPAQDLPGDKFMPGDANSGRTAFQNHCAACHSLGQDIIGGEVGPNLAGVYLARSGSRPGFAYSGAMSRSNQIWDVPSLIVFMESPAGVVPGTIMSMPPLEDSKTRRDIATFLRTAAVTR